MPVTDDRKAIHGRRDLPRNECTTCRHAEFVHGDADPRLCLYSECACSGFAVRTAAVDAA